MSYRLGIDIGTTYTAAAVCRDGVSTMVGLGNRSMQVPSVLYLRPNGHFDVGEPAEARGAAEPNRVAREFKRRIGDPVPILVGGAPFSAEALTAKLLRWVVEVATERQGEPPESITVAHPANWGGFKLDFLHQAFLLADLADARTCTEPEAAAITYSGRRRMGAGQRIAIYDLGGGTFDAAALCNDAGHFQLLGSPEGIEHLGGLDFDEAVFQHVLRSIGAEARELDCDDPGIVWELTRLRRDCVVAKESLSVDTEATLPVVIGSARSTVRLTRAEFEDLARPTIEQTVGMMRRVLHSADVQPQDVSAFVLVGGSSRIPLVSEVLVEAFRRPLAMDTHPKHDIALGAASFTEPGSATRTARPSFVPPSAPNDHTAVLPRIRSEEKPPPNMPGADKRGSIARTRRRMLLAGAAAVLVAGCSAAFVLWPMGHNDRASLANNVMLVPRRVGTGPSRIWSVSNDRAEPKPLTDGTHDDLLPAMSHDRKIFAYVRQLAPLASCSPQTVSPCSTLRVMNTDGSNDRALFATQQRSCPDYLRPSFSPDDKELAVQCRFGSGDVSIFLATLEGKPTRQLVRGHVGAPTFSHYGRFVAFWQGRNSRLGDTRIVKIPTAGGSIIPLTDGVSDSAPAWSPDGKFIAFSRKNPISNLDVWIYNVLTRASRQLTSDAADEQNPSWSPDGSQIAYEKGAGVYELGRVVNTHVWTINVSGGDENAHPLATPQSGVTEGTPVWTAR